MTPQPTKTFTMPPPVVGPRLCYEINGPWLDEDGVPVTDDDGEARTWAEAFETVPQGTVPAGVFGDLAAGVSIVDGRVRYETANVLRFLRATMRTTDRGRFDELVRDHRRGVHTGALGDVALAVIEELQRVPSGVPSNSPGGRPAQEGSSDPEPDPGANGSST